jgi:hypothetical protein
LHRVLWLLLVLIACAPNAAPSQSGPELVWNAEVNAAAGAAVTALVSYDSSFIGAWANPVGSDTRKLQHARLDAAEVVILLFQRGANTVMTVSDLNDAERRDPGSLANTLEPVLIAALDAAFPRFAQR